VLVSAPVGAIEGDLASVLVSVLVGALEGGLTGVLVSVLVSVLEGGLTSGKPRDVTGRRRERIVVARSARVCGLPVVADPCRNLKRPPVARFAEHTMFIHQVPHFGS
jgi:hypothetical protein